MPPASSTDHVADPEENEISPLLGNDGSNEQSDNEESVSLFSQLLPVGLAISMLILLESGAMLQAIPLNQVLEDIICRNFHRSDRSLLMATNDCSSDRDVQGELATLKGWQGTFDLIPGIVTAIPYGLLTDKYGRRPILFLAIFGLILAQAFYMTICFWPRVFPVRLTWLSSVFTFIGGGPVVFNGILYAAVSDLAPAAYRSNVFFYMQGLVLMAGFALGPLTVVLMAIDPWLPIVLGFVLYLPGLLIAFSLPETIKISASEEVSSHEVGHESDPATLWGEFTKGLKSLRSATAFFIQGNRFVVALLSTLLLTTLGRHVQDIMLQYARRRYGWSWGQAGLLLSLKAGVLVILLLLILPACSTALIRYFSYSVERKDLLLARTSCAILFLGAVIIGLSTNQVIMIVGHIVYCLGIGYNMVLRSLLASIVEPHHRGTMFNTAGLLESLSAFISGPLLAVSFRLGLELDGVWIGLPFLAAAVLFSFALVILFMIRVPST